jgi:hypothetical protein
VNSKTQKKEKRKINPENRETTKQYLLTLKEPVHHQTIFATKP